MKEFLKAVSKVVITNEVKQSAKNTSIDYQKIASVVPPSQRRYRLFEIAS